MAKAGRTHDYTIASIGGTALGFMFPRQNGRRPFSIRDARSLTPRLLTEAELTEAQFPLEYSQFVSQSDWRGGIGGVTYRSGELEAVQLAAALKIDGTVKGRLVLAREIKSTTVDAAPSVYYPTGFATVGTEVWAFIQQDVYSWNYTTKAWVKGTVPVAANVLYRNGIEFDAKTFAPCWDYVAAVADSPSRYIYKADADANWTRIGAGTGTQIRGAKFFAKGRNSAGGDILWCGYIERADGTFGTNIIASTTDPTTLASWSTEVSIGDSSYPITALVENEDTILICKPDGIYAYYADGTQRNLGEGYRSQIHPDNFKGAIRWGQRVLLPLGNGGLHELMGGQIRDISLRRSMPELSQYHGRVVAIHGEPNYVYILVDDSTNLKYHLFKGELLAFEGVVDYRWHHQGSVTYQATTNGADHVTLFFEAVPSGTNIHRRCWIGAQSLTLDLLPYFLPQETDIEDGYTNDTDGLIQFVAYDKNMKNVNATWAKIDVESRNLGAGGRQFTFDYRLDQGAWTTDLADAAGNADGVVDTSPSQTLTFPSGTTGKVLELRATPALTTVGATSPELLDLRVTYNIRPATLKVLPLRAYLADGQVTLNGARKGRPKLDLAQWETWDSQAAEVTVVDPRGTSRTMAFLPGAMRVEEIANEATRRVEYLVSTLLAEV